MSENMQSEEETDLQSCSTCEEESKAPLTTEYQGFQLHSSGPIDAQFSGESSTGSGTSDTTHHSPNNDEPTTSSLGAMQLSAVSPREAVDASTRKHKLNDAETDRVVSLEGNIEMKVKEKNSTMAYVFPIRSTSAGKLLNNESTTPSQTGFQLHSSNDTDNDQAASIQGDVKVHVQDGQSIEMHGFTVGSISANQLPNNGSTSTSSGTDRSLQDGVVIKGGKITYFPKKPIKFGYNVFEAVRKGVIHEEIVVKFIPDIPEKDKQKETDKTREVENLVNAGDSEYVVKYLDSGFCEYNHQKAIFILMERCEAQTLADKIKEGELSYEKRKEYVHCIAEGLQHLKNKGILHRDLKPHNILFRKGKPVISDFGLSKHLPQGKSNTQQSCEDTGTHGWRAPETTGVGNKTSHKTDVFSSGLLYHFVLTNGFHAYPGEKEIHRQTYIDDDKDGTKCNLQKLGDRLDGVIAIDVIGSMLRRDPSKRPSIDEVLKHIFFLKVEDTSKFFHFAKDLLQSEISIANKPQQNEKTKADALSSFSGNADDTSQKGKTNADALNSFDGEYGQKVREEMHDWKKRLLLTDQEKKTIVQNFLKVDVSVEVDVNVMKTKADKFKDLVTEVIRLIRNRDVHYKEDKDERGIFFTQSQLFKFFFDRFPHLIIYVFNKIKHEFWKPR